jgi:hypothetical protein
MREAPVTCEQKAATQGWKLQKCSKLPIYGDGNRKRFPSLSASVLGKEAEHYRFTSALPVAILKLLAPALNSRIYAPI